MSFAWILAIIAGSVILFLAIFFAGKLISWGGQQQDAETSAILSIILDPLETSLETYKGNELSSSAELRIYNDKCSVDGNFGSQKLGAVTESGLGTKWREPFYGHSTKNEYIFSRDTEQGKKFMVFSMPFNFPFKVSSLIFLSSEDYCFLDAPDEIKDKFQGSKITKIKFSDTKSNCSKQSIKVCFGSGVDCDSDEIVVYGNTGGYDYGSVIKNGNEVYYTGSLLYGAIFSSPELYECNVNRLVKRTINLAYLYKDKIEFVQKRGCDSQLDIPLTNLINTAKEFKSSKDLSDLQVIAKEIEDTGGCKIY